MKHFFALGLLALALASVCARSLGQAAPLAQPRVAPMAPATQALLQKFLNAPVFWKQAIVGAQLVALKDKGVVPALLKLLQSPSRAQRCNAGRVLAGLGDNRGLFAVIAELKDTAPRPTKMVRDDGKTPYVEGQIIQDRYYAAHVLGAIGDRRATPALIEALQDPTINYQAAIMLGQLGDKRAIPALRSALERAVTSDKLTSPNTDMKLWAGYALLGLGDDRGLAVITSLLNEAPSTITRRNAVEALTQWGDVRAVPALMRATRDKQIEVRVGAITALGRIGDARAKSALQIAARDKSTAQTAARIGFNLELSPPSDFERVTVSEAATRALKKINAKM